MKILYLHGLESKLNDEKRAILEKYGKVIAPDLDYKSNPNMIRFLLDEYRNQNINVIIGSSMGGFVGYYLANTLGICTLLYNPALPYRGTIIQKTPALFPVKHAPLMRIVLGGQDTIIKAKDNLAYFSQNIIPNSDYSIVLRNDLAHQIPIEVFEDETKAFFSSALIVLLSLD